MKNKIGYLGLLGIQLSVLGVVGSVAFASTHAPSTAPIRQQSAQVSVKTTEPSEHEVAITGSALTSASEAALAHAKAGSVTETEINDEESYYEVEVTLPSGNQVDVQLDQNFKVVGEKVEGSDNEKETSRN